AVFAGQVPQAAAQGQAAYAGRRNNAAGDRQAKGVGGAVDVAPGAASADAHGSRLGINARVADEREIDDQAIIADPQPSGVVSAAPDRNEEAVLTTEVDCRNDVGHVGATRDQGGTLVDHTVVDLACSIVALIALLKEFSPQARFQSVDT